MVGHEVFSGLDVWACAGCDWTSATGTLAEAVAKHDAEVHVIRAVPGFVGHWGCSACDWTYPSLLVSQIAAQRVHDDLRKEPTMEIDSSAEDLAEKLRLAEQDRDIALKKISDAYRALNQPIDTKVVLDNPYGRSLWQAGLAAEARDILSRGDM